MKRSSIFVDASYVRLQVKKLGPNSNPSFSGMAIDYPSLSKYLQKEIHDQVPDAYLLRIYWYDCMDQKGNTAEHEAIKRLDNFKLRLDSEDIICGRMMSDLMELAKQQAITHALLVTNRVCMAPSVEVAQSMGLRVHLLSLGEPFAVPTSLTAEADLKRFWSAADIQRFALPSVAVLDTPRLGLWTQAASAAADPADADGSIQQAEELPLTRVAQVASARIKEGSQAMVFAALKPGMRALPREIDSALLSVGRQELGRALTEPEKRQLRRELQALIRQDFEDRLSKTYGHPEELA